MPRPISKLQFARVLFCLLALARFSAAATDAPERHQVIQTDGPPVLLQEILRDDYLAVEGKPRADSNVTVKIPAYRVKDVVHADGNVDYKRGLECLDEGKFRIAAACFYRALRENPPQKWALEYYNYALGKALFLSGMFKGIQREGVNFSLPPAEYFKRALAANPKSRFLPDILTKLPVCLAKEEKWDEADAALKDAEQRLQTFRKEALAFDGHFLVPAARALAGLAVADATVCQLKVAAGKSDWLEARDKWTHARLCAENFADLRVEVWGGLFNALAAMRDYATAKTLADGVIEKEKSAPGPQDWPLLSLAYSMRGQAELQRGLEHETQGRKLAANSAFADARWAFLHAIAYADNEEASAAWKYQAAVCYDKLKATEPDAADNAARYWRGLLNGAAPPEIKELAARELKQR